MIDRVQAGVLLVGLSIVAVTVLFYWTVPEQWMAAILLSTVFWIGSFWLTFFWASSVVFSYVKSVTERTAAEVARPAPPWVQRRAVSRGVLGVGVPLVIGFLQVLSLLFYPGGWIGTLVLVACVVALVRVLQYYSFFAEPVGPETRTQKEET